MYQSQTIIGRISEPEAKENGEGNLFIRIGIAVQEGAKKEGQEPPVEWFNAILSGPFAKTMKDKLSKGQLVFVEGRQKTRQYEDNDGVKRRSVTTFVNTLRILNDPKGKTNTDQANQPGNDDEGMDDDIPF